MERQQGLAERIFADETVMDADYDSASLRKVAARKSAEPRYRAEVDINTDVINHICSLPLGHARKVHGDANTQIGEPDIDACVRGRSVKIEGKTGRNRPTTAQRLAMERWRKAGALTGWFRSVQDARDLLDHIDDPDFAADLEYPGCVCPRHQQGT
jgi:hypothetical protein